ncbi:MAG TPA: hypothetical protein VIY86_02190, partial [Pirellulaceae bacterium]
VFLLGVTSWRVMEITRDRVLVTPAPGEPARMPFWRGEGSGRPLEFGRAIGALTRKLTAPSEVANPGGTARMLMDHHGLDRPSVEGLLDYLREQVKATGDAPTDRVILVETFPDEIGDSRICILSPFGARVHAPWAFAVAARLREESSRDLDYLWTDDGIVFRLPSSESPPTLEQLVPRSEDIEALVTQQLSGTALFASRFRENAARALLLPRRQPGRRTPLWQQRRRSADLLAAASRYDRFPILLETYRECLRDVCDLPGLTGLLRDIERKIVRVHVVERNTPSPFASSLMFHYTANFLYQTDTPLAEQRAQVLTLDHGMLRELLGNVDLRELLDPDVCDEVARELQGWGDARIRHADDLHAWLLRLGALTHDEIVARSWGEDAGPSRVAAWIQELETTGRAVPLRMGGRDVWAAAEDAARYRDGLGCSLPPGLPEAFLEPVAEPLLDLVARIARTHLPTTTRQL